MLPSLVLSMRYPNDGMYRFTHSLLCLSNRNKESQIPLLVSKANFHAENRSDSVSVQLRCFSGPIVVKVQKCIVEIKWGYSRNNGDAKI